MTNITQKIKSASTAIGYVYLSWIIGVVLTIMIDTWRSDPDVHIGVDTAFDLIYNVTVESRFKIFYLATYGVLVALPWLLPLPILLLAIQNKSRYARNVYLTICCIQVVLFVVGLLDSIGGNTYGLYGLLEISSISSGFTLMKFRMAFRPRKKIS